MIGILVRSLAPLLMIPYGSFVIRPLIDSGVGGWTAGVLIAAPLVGFLIGCVR